MFENRRSLLVSGGFLLEPELPEHHLLIFTVYFVPDSFMLCRCSLHRLHLSENRIRFIPRFRYSCVKYCSFPGI